MRALVVPLALTLSLSVAVPAPAAEVRVEQRFVEVYKGMGRTETTLRFAAGAGEANRLSLVRGPLAIDVLDAGAPVAAGPGCVAIEGGARCGIPTLDVLAEVDLADGDDRFVARAAGEGEIGLTVRGGDGADALRGADAVTAQLLVGDAGDDELTGGAGPDRLAGGTGADRMAGGGGADRFEEPVQAETDEMDGGEGFDWVSYRARAARPSWRVVHGGPDA